MRCWKHRQQIVTVAAQYDRLGEAIAWNMAGLSGAHRRNCRFVQHDIIRDVAVQILCKSWRYRHSAPPSPLSKGQGAAPAKFARSNAWSILAAMMKSFSCRPLIFLVCRETFA